MFQKPTTAEIAWRFGYHPPDGTARVKHERIRAKIIEVAGEIVAHTPCCPEQARALNALDEAMMLANAAIARHSTPMPVDSTPIENRAATAGYNAGDDALKDPGAKPAELCGQCGMKQPCECKVQEANRSTAAAKR